MYLSVIAKIKVMFANATTAQLLQHKDRCLQKALHVTAKATQKYSNCGNYRVHRHHYDMGLFKDPCYIALAISTDGTQLTMKKQSDTWLVILMLLSLHLSAWKQVE